MASLIERLQSAMVGFMPTWRGLRAIRPVSEQRRETPVIHLPLRRSKIDYFDAA